MNDLETLRDAWGEPAPPSPDAYRSARAALMQEIAQGGAPRVAQRPSRRRGVRLGWLVGAATVAVAAAVAFIVIPGTHPSGRSPSIGDNSGRELLLAAAVVAESQPETVRTYWHVSTAFHFDDATVTEQYWTTHDGGRYQSSGSGVVGSAVPGSGFEVAADHLTLTELQQLPTDAAALTAWITDSVEEWGRPDLAADTAHELTRLLWRVPAPPAVRAAAFRAVADLSNVTRLGDQDGNWVLRIALAELPPADKFGGALPEGVGELTVVIDPATSQLVSITNYQGTHEILLAEWTDDMPPILEPPAQPGEAVPPPTAIG